MASVHDRELRLAVEVVPGRLSWVSLTSAPQPHPQRHFFSVDNELVYWNFFLDFGPLNLGHVYRYCQLLNAKLNDPKFKDKMVYHYCSSHPHKRANSCFLFCAYAVLYLNKTPEEAFRPFRSVSPPFPNWHDATPGACPFVLTILDTLQGLAKAREHGFFNLAKFNIEEYEFYEQVENGDLNWCLEGKFLAFAGPHATHEMTPGGYHSLCPDDYVNYFKRKNVQLVIRLNKKYYDARRFTNHGIEHMELYFLDGSNPPDHLLAKFLEKVEAVPGAVAVHCKAGLGRTGSCIGCYMMKHYRLTAEEVIGWLRVVRPGSIIGPQQQFMKDSQARMWREGDLMRSRMQAAGGVGVSPGRVLTSPLSPRAAGAAGSAPPGGSEESSRDSPGKRVAAAGSSSTGVGSSKYAADRSGEAQGDVLRARRAQASPMGSPVGSPAGVSKEPPLSPKGAGFDEDQYASPSPVPNLQSPPSPGSPAKSSSFGRFLGGWK